MIQFTIQLAGIPITVCAQYPQTREFCKDYLKDGPSVFGISVTPQHIAHERRILTQRATVEGRKIDMVPDHVLETLAVYRQIAEHMIEHNVLLFHASAIAVDGQAYLFTAPSGTGKSTHTRLWRKLFGNRAIMIDDDKPLLKCTDKGVIVYGTPWNGKHHLGNNVSFPLKAVCLLHRDTQNRIKTISAWDAFPTLLKQSYHSEDENRTKIVLEMLDIVIAHAALYELGCNMQSDAARVAYEGMTRTNIFEDIGGIGL